MIAELEVGKDGDRLVIEGSLEADDAEVIDIRRRKGSLSARY